MYLFDDESVNSPSDFYCRNDRKKAVAMLEIRVTLDRYIKS